MHNALYYIFSVIPKKNPYWIVFKKAQANDNAVITTLPRLLFLSHNADAQETELLPDKPPG